MWVSVPKGWLPGQRIEFGLGKEWFPPLAGRQEKERGLEYKWELMELVKPQNKENSLYKGRHEVGRTECRI